MFNDCFNYFNEKGYIKKVSFYFFSMRILSALKRRDFLEAYIIFKTIFSNLFKWSYRELFIMKIDLKKSPEYYFMILVMFSAYFSVSALTINPVYIIGFSVVLLSFLYLKVDKVDKFYLFYLFYFFVSLCGFFLGLYFFEVKAKDQVVYLSSILYLYCILLGSAVIIFGSKFGQDLRIAVYKNVYDALIIFMGVDLISRIAMAANNGNFYDYKWGGFYFDSNFTGTIILLFLIFSIYLKENKIFDIGMGRFLILVFLFFMYIS